MPITLTRIPKARGGRIPIEEIDPDVSSAIDEAYQDCLVNDGARLEAQFDSKADAETFLHEARSYAYQHEPRYVVTGNPTAKGVARFRVELYEAAADVAEAS